MLMFKRTISHTRRVNYREITLSLACLCEEFKLSNHLKIAHTPFIITIKKYMILLFIS